MNIQRLKLTPGYRFILVSLLYILIFLLLTKYSALFAVAAGVMVWYAPAGLNVGLLLVGGLHYAPVIALAGLLGGRWILAPNAPLLALIIVALTTPAVETVAVALLKRTIGSDWQQWVVREVGLFVLIMMAAPVFVALLGVTNYCYFGMIPWSSYVPVALGWWIGDVIGILTVTPVILFGLYPLTQLSGRPGKIRASFADNRQALLLACQMLSIPLALWFCFLSPLAASFDLFYFCFLPLLWIAFSHGLPGAALTTLVINTGATFIVSTSAGTSAVTNLQFFLMVLAVTGLFLGGSVTERKRMEKALQREQEFSQRVLELSPGIIYIYDLIQKRNIFVNRQLHTVLGYSPVEAEAMGDKIIPTLMHPDDFAGMPAVIERLNRLTSGQVATAEYRMRHKEGAWRWIQTSETVFAHNDAGQVQHILGIAEDITERKRAEEIQNARLRLVGFSTSYSMPELLQATLDEAEALTGSSIGFYHFLEADQKTVTLQAWSTHTTSIMCSIEDEGQHYDIADAGVWVDCVHQRRPVIHNDYRSLPHRRGLPAGHALLVRQLVVPVFRNERIVAILGVGNKASNYDEHDVKVVSLLADLAWDIVERVQAQAALRESEALYESLVEMLPHSLYRVDLHGRVTFANSVLLNDLDVALEQVLGKTAYDFYPEELARKYRRDDQQVMETGRPMTLVEENISPVTGKKRFVEVVKNPIVNAEGKIVGLQGMFWDITERKQAEARIHFQATLLDAVGQAVIATDLDGIITYFNRAAEKLYGWPATEAVGRNIMSVTVPVGSQTEAAEIMDRMVAGCNWSGEFLVQRRDGTIFPALVHNSPVFDQAEQLIGIIGVSADITDRKQAEARLKTSLDEKNVLLQELYHRTKNNMNVIRSMLSLQAAYVKDEQALAAFEDMQHRIQSMAMVHQKLYQSKNLSSIDLKDYISDLSSYLLRSYKVSPARIGIMTQMDNVPVSIETAMPCGLIVNELVSNAFKHAFPKNRPGEIKIKLKKSHDGEIMLCVADNGVGVPAGFDLKSHETLGLTTIINIAEHQLQGTIEFETDHGVACRVRFKDGLPMSQT